MGPNDGFHNHTWQPSDWVEVVHLLNEEGITPLLVGADTKDDHDYAKWFWTMADCTTTAISAVGKTSIPEYCALIERAACWVGLNSGGGIVSAMRGTPTVMLWSDSKYPIYGCEDNVLHTNMKTSWLHPDQMQHYRTLSLGSPELTPRALVNATLEVIR
jgi:ADP-heptose:LPS heptosyltransferase